jgi:hypothetical protein
MVDFLIQQGRVYEHTQMDSYYRFGIGAQHAGNAG